MTYLMKEWKEQSRSAGLWLSFSMVAVISIFILLEARALPSEHGFTMMLLSLNEMNLLLIPLISLFISSFSVIQEKELKTLLILTTKKESYSRFLVKKSGSIQLITNGLWTAWLLIIAILAKPSFNINGLQLFYFLITGMALFIIFNQIGIFLGSICSHRLQLVGAGIFTWFFFVFITDLIFLHLIPSVHLGNVGLFSIFFFLDPLHASQFFLETSLGVFSLDHKSRLMEKLVWVTPALFFIVNMLFWVFLSFGAAVLCKGRVGSK
jgi:ABC-type transport system involved in multi-copper enzyme maturation permease subunit